MRKYFKFNLCIIPQLVTITLTFVSVFFLGQVRMASAASYTWNGGGIGTWDTSSNNWTGAASTPVWDITNGTNNVALFNANADTATVSGTVYANGVTFNSSATNALITAGTLTLGGITPTISYGVATAGVNSAISATPAVTISGSSGGRLGLGGNNSFAGGVSVSGGYIVMNNNNALGYRTPLVVKDSATVNINSKSPQIGSLTLSNGNCGVSFNGNLYFYSANPVITSDGDSAIKPSEIWNNYSASVNFNFVVNSGTNTVGLNNNFLLGGGNNSLTKSGTGMMKIEIGNSNGNRYTNALTINGGIYSVDRLYDANTTGTGLGGSVNDATNLVLNGGTLQFTGANNNDGAGKVRNITDRLFSVGTSGGTLDASGSAAVNFYNTGAMGFNNQSGARTLTLTGSNTSTNTLAVTIGNNGGPTTLVKDGTGSWTISGTNIYSGGTIISNGVLKLAASGSISSSSVINVRSPSTFDVSPVFNFSIASNQVLCGNGIVTGAVIVAAGGGIGGGDTNAAGTLTVTNNLTLAEGSIIYWNYINGTGGVVQVGNTLNLPVNATVRIVGTKPFPSSGVIAKYSGTVNGATSAWTVECGAGGRNVKIDPYNKSLVLFPSGTVIIFR